MSCRKGERDWKVLLGYRSGIAVVIYQSTLNDRSMSTHHCSRCITIDLIMLSKIIVSKLEAFKSCRVIGAWHHTAGTRTVAPPVPRPWTALASQITTRQSSYVPFLAMIDMFQPFRHPQFVKLRVNIGLRIASAGDRCRQKNFARQEMRAIKYDYPHSLVPSTSINRRLRCTIRFCSCKLCMHILGPCLHLSNQSPLHPP